eukprot:9707272-Alexandrium_andersonii.AAC.1
MTEGKASAATPLPTLGLRGTKKAAKVAAFNKEEPGINPQTGKVTHVYRCRDCGDVYGRDQTY